MGALPGRKHMQDESFNHNCGESGQHPVVGFSLIQRDCMIMRRTRSQGQMVVLSVECT